MTTTTLNPSEALAFTVKTWDAEHLIQIVNPAGEVLVTVGAMCGGGPVREFGIWHGEGVDDNSEETRPDTVMRIEAGRYASESEYEIAKALAWKRVVAAAYAAAVNLALD